MFLESLKEERRLGESPLCRHSPMDKGSMELGVQFSDTRVTYYVQSPAWPRSLEGRGRRERERDGGKGVYSQKLGALQMASGSDS